MAEDASPNSGSAPDLRPSLLDRSASDWRLRLATVGLALVALAARTVDLGEPSIWFDEALEYSRAAAGWATVLFGRQVDQDPPLFAAFNHLWFGLGRDEFWLRVPSALLGAASVSIAGYCFSRRFGAPIGLTAALLLALAPVQVYYGQELNQYAAMVFLTIVAYLSFERVVNQGQSHDWRLHTGVTLLALWTHYGLAFPITAMSLYLAAHVLRGRSRRAKRRLLLYSGAVGGALLVLVGLGFLERLAIPHLQRRFGGTFLQKELDYIADIFWREVLVFFLTPFSGGPVLRIVAALSLLAAGGAIWLWRSGASGRRLVGITFFGALAVTYPADGMGWYPMGHRYVLFASPAFYCALAAAIALAWHWIRPVGATLYVVLILLFAAFSPHEPWPNQYLAVPREALRPILTELDTLVTGKDCVYVYYGAQPAFDYYRTAHGHLNSTREVVRGKHPEQASPVIEARRIADECDGGPVWLVYSHDQPGDRDRLITALLGLGYDERKHITDVNAAAIQLRPEGKSESAGAP